MVADCRCGKLRVCIAENRHTCARHPWYINALALAKSKQCIARTLYARRNARARGRQRERFISLIRHRSGRTHAHTGNMFVCACVRVRQCVCNATHHSVSRSGSSNIRAHLTRIPVRLGSHASRAHPKPHCDAHVCIHAGTHAHTHNAGTHTCARRPTGQRPRHTRVSFRPPEITGAPKPR